MQRLALMGVSLLVFAAMWLIPPGDYTKFYAPAMRAWLSGEALYSEATLGFFYFPPSLLLLGPLSLLPDRLAEALLNTLSLLALLGALAVLCPAAAPGSEGERQRRLGLALAVVNLYTLSVVLIAQWDLVALGTVGLAWWAVGARRPLWLGAALALMISKPTHVPLIVLLLAWRVRGWPLARLAAMVAVPLGLLVLSFVVLGLDWPARWVHALSDSSLPPGAYDVSFQGLLGRGAGGLIGLALVGGWAVWVRGRTETPEAPIVALVVALLAAPYTGVYSLALAAPAMAWVGMRAPRVATAWWAVSAVLLWVFLTGRQGSPVWLYPLGLLVWIAWRTWPRAATPEPEGQGS